MIKKAILGGVKPVIVRSRPAMQPGYEASAGPVIAKEPERLRQSRFAGLHLGYVS